jgi:uncharacterized protein YuzE
MFVRYGGQPSYNRRSNGLLEIVDCLKGADPLSDYSIRVEVDHNADAAYIALLDSPVAETVEVAEHVLVDLDEYRMVVGIEVLKLTARIPFDDLNSRFHVRSELVEMLRKIQPSISGFLSVTVGTDSTIRSSNRALTSA